MCGRVDGWFSVNIKVMCVGVLLCGACVQGGWLCGCWSDERGCVAV